MQALKCAPRDADDYGIAMVDRYGEAGLKGGMGGAAGQGDFNNPFDIFEQFFGGGMGGGMGGFGGGGFGGWAPVPLGTLCEARRHHHSSHTTEAAACDRGGCDAGHC